MGGKPAGWSAQTPRAPRPQLVQGLIQAWATQTVLSRASRPDSEADVDCDGGEEADEDVAG